MRNGCSYAARFFNFYLRSSLADNVMARPFDSGWVKYQPITSVTFLAGGRIHDPWLRADALRAVKNMRLSWGSACSGLFAWLHLAQVIQKFSPNR
jgi:hypothetical protein